VEFNSRGVEHLVHDVLFYDETWIKREILPYIDKYIENGKLVAYEGNTKKDKKINANRYYYVEIDIKSGKKCYVGIEDTFDDINGRRLIVYAIMNKLREDAIMY